MSEFNPRVTKGLYGTLQDDRIIPKELLKERVIRKISMFLANFNLLVNNLNDPIFIIGSARSGTSILLQNVDSHNDIAIFPGEALDLWFPNAFPWIYSDLKRPPYWKDGKGYVTPTLNNWKKQNTNYLKSTFSLFNFFIQKKKFVNKQAMSAFILPLMNKIYPNAKYIHIFRDGRDVAFSYAEQEYARMQIYPDSYIKSNNKVDFNEMLMLCSNLWNQQILEIEKIKKEQNIFNNKNFIELSYEDFCESPDKINDILFNFIGVKKTTQIKTPSVSKSHKRYLDKITVVQLKEMENTMSKALSIKGYLN